MKYMLMLAATVVFSISHAKERGIQKYPAPNPEARTITLDTQRVQSDWVPISPFVLVNDTKGFPDPILKKHFANQILEFKDREEIERQHDEN